MSDSASPALATFRLYREHDTTGISGEGVIAEGVQFSDGWVVTHWLDQPPMWEPKTDVWHHKGTGPVTKIHGHGGSTRIVWADDTERRAEFGADIAEAYDVPAAMLGSHVERANLHRQMTRALRDASLEARTKYKPVVGLGSVPGPTEVKGSLDDFADAIMPIVSKILDQRDQALRANGRAYGLARTWKRAHGSAMFLVRAAGAELSDVLDEEAAPEHDWHHRTPLSGLVCRRCDLAHKFWSGGACVADEPAETMAAVECSAQYHGHQLARLCIRAAQHLGDHIDEHGFRWSDTVAIYPVVDGEPLCGRAYASSCSNPDHACKICGECVCEHPGEGGCAGVGFHSRAEGSLEELADAVRSVLGIDVRTVPADVNTWLLTACRQLERSEDAREHLRGQRNAVAQALREVLAVFRPVTADGRREVLAYEAPHVIHPSNFNRWRAALEGLPANCQKPGGCTDCPHEPEA